MIEEQTIFMTMNKCPICKNRIRLGNQAAHKCHFCASLINLDAKNIDYRHGGGQDIPDRKVSLKRLKNAKCRFAIIRNVLDTKTKYVFIDIGSGSGEMLEAAKSIKSIDDTIGFEPNKILFNHSKQNNNVINSEFIPNKIIKFYERPKIISICHILEHLSLPSGLLKEVIKFMKKDDFIYIEVPSYEGRAFRYRSFEWGLWYPEHKFLFSTKALFFLANKFNLSSIKIGKRVFYHEHYKKILLKAIYKEPQSVLKHLVFSKNFQEFVDSFFGDYLYLIACK